MTAEPIAVIGASCRFPGAANLEQFWNLLIERRSAIGAVDDQRWSTRSYFHPRPSEAGKSYSWAAGLLEQVDKFDAEFFGISPREALQMDPQQRLLLELAWEALEDAGIAAQSLKGAAGGVYIGASAAEYANRRHGDPASIDAYFMTGITLSIFSNRLSYFLDWHGPSLTVDTACSSSLVALHLACEDLRHGRAPLALVGGVNLMLSPYPFIGFSHANMLSKRGQCFAFDARADGYVRGEGGGIVLLKPLAAALRDGDSIRGVILGSGTNSDGRTVGLSLPSKASQASLLAAVYREAGIEPGALGFIEAHGTGTPAGDPAEAAAIGETLGRGRAAPLPIGSVKTNIGHLEAASGMAGFLKAMLALERRRLPASRNFAEPNPQIDFAALNLTVAAEAVPLRHEAADRLIAGVSSFGFGGTNAHAILASAPITAVADLPTEPLPPVLLSARSKPALAALAQQWSGLLADRRPDEAAALIKGAARGRDHHPLRLAAVAPTPRALADALAAAARGDEDPAILAGTVQAGGVAFVFSGNGAQWSGMARDAFEQSAAFREALAAADELLQPLLGWSATERLGREGAVRDLDRTDVAQPLLFAIQVAIVGALRALGVEAAATIGHSVGEIAAAWAAGALSLADAAKIVVIRSRHQQRTKGEGRMAVLGAASSEVEETITRLGLSLEIAAVNARQSLTVAGPLPELHRLQAEAEARGWVFKLLDLDYAFHTRVMDRIRPGLIADLAGIVPGRSARPFISTVTGEAMDGAELDGDYWWRNIRHPVRFAEAIGKLVDGGIRVFVEIGPKPALQSYLRELLRERERNGEILATLSRTRVTSDPFPRLAAACHVVGQDISRASIFDGPRALHGLPSYPWQRERYWVATTGEGLDIARPRFDHPLLGARRDAEAVEWHSHIDAALLPWLGDHRVGKSILFPAAAMIEMALAAARIRSPKAAAIEVRDLEIARPVAIDAGRMRELRLRLDPESGRFELAGRARLADEPWSRHATGSLAALPEPLLPPPAHPPLPIRVIEASRLYAAAAARGLDYGPAFRQVERVEVIGPDEALVRLGRGLGGGFLVDPTLLDAALQGVIALLGERADASERESLLLPWRFDRVRWLAETQRTPSYARVRLHWASRDAADADLALFDAAGFMLLEMTGCAFRRSRALEAAAPDTRILRFEAIPVPLSPMPLEPAMLAQARQAVTGLAEPGDEAHAEAALLIDAFAAAAAFEAIRALAPPGVEFSVAGLVENGMVAPDAAPLVANLLAILRAQGAAVEERGVWRLSATSGLPAAADIWRSILFGAPDLAAAAALLAQASARLPDIIRAGPQAAPPIAAALRNSLLHAAPLGNRLIAALGSALDAILADWPNDRSLRILEIGAGDGTMTRRLLRRLAAANPHGLDFVASDPGADTLPRLAEAVRPFGRAAVVRWDPNSAGEEDREAGSFDIVIDMRLLGASRLNAASLAAIRRRLAPHGVFLAAQAGPHRLWDLLFGAEADWWRTAPADGSPLSSLRNAAEWRRSLEDAGFEEAEVQPLALEPWPILLVSAAAPASLVIGNGLEAPTAEGAVVIIADEADALGEALLQRLEANGRPAWLVSPSALGNGVGPSVIEEARKRPGKPTLLLLPGHDPAEGPVARAANRLAEALQAARIAADAEARLWLVTRGGQTMLPAAMFEPSEASVIGFGRVIANEMPALEVRRVDLDAALAIDDAGTALVAELTQADGETEILWGREGRFAPRLRRGLPPPRKAASEPARLMLAEPGSLDSLRWESDRPAAPGPGEIAIEVRAAGLNFRDVMWAMGLLPEDALRDGFAGSTLGMECAGIVKAVGPRAGAFKPGDRVMAFAPAAFRSQLVTKAYAAMPMPDGLAFAAAATIPVAFITVLYSLGRLARLQAGERILIHGAAGGVGLAAIQYAKHVGAEIFATAGSPTKRALLRALGVEHVFDSRSLRFADEVKAATGGAGVDVVLNSLGGEAMERSLGLLRPFGRFLELGKRDFYLNTRIGLRPLRQNIAYFAVDADALLAQDATAVGAAFGELQGLFATGALRPLPYLRLPFSEAVEAFRLMREAGHVGKIVLEPDADMVVEPALVPFAARGDRTYLVTGGLGGFGLAAARWLVEKGARYIALLSRRSPESDEAVAALGVLDAAGAVTSRAFACDVSDIEMLAETLERIRESMPAIGGVLHAAMVSEDAMIGALDAARLESALRPKLGGAENLDRLTRRDAIELFVLFSSATVLLGSPGQGAYVAANAALEAVASRRRAAGLPGLAVAWGPIADVGYLERHPEAGEAMARRLGVSLLPAREALAALPKLLAAPLASAAFAEIDWRTDRARLPIQGQPLFGAIASGIDERRDAAAVGALITELDPRNMHIKLVELLRDALSAILRLRHSQLDADRPLSELGLDSLMAVELQMALRHRLGFEVPALGLSEGATLSTLASRVAAAIRGTLRDTAAAMILAKHEAIEDVEAAARAHAASPPETPVKTRPE